MRKCIRCNTEMIDNLEVSITNGSYGVCIKEKGLFKTSLGKLKCAVCKDCGYVETYLEDTEKVRNLMKDKIQKI